uniref:DUF6745 domain-containing protein n=1 Tax=viral metagenome TaxID=1070528 RepID=A0A6M3X4B9_9ZZZZ
MKKTLTKKEEVVLERIKQKWLKPLSEHVPLNKEKSIEFVHWLYEHSGFKPPPVLFVHSPMAAQILMNAIEEDETKNGLSVPYVVPKHIEKYAGTEAVDIEVPILGYTKKVLSNKPKYFRFASYGNLWDYGWCSLYDFLTEIKVVSNEYFNKYVVLYDTGIYDMIQMEEACIVCEMPLKINRNEAGVLHSEDSPAIEWRDGFKLYYWNGVNLPDKYIEDKANLTYEDIMAETNIEKRRCMREILGNGFATTLGLEPIPIDEDTDSKGKPIRLFRTARPDNITNKHIYFANVRDSSTDREYFICVKGEPTNVWAAVASSFGKSKEDYKLIMET